MDTLKAAFIKSLVLCIVVILPCSNKVFSEPVLNPQTFKQVKTTVTYLDLIDYALKASGLSENEHEIYLKQFTALLESLPEESIRSDTHPGERLLLELHENLFTRYRESQTYVNRVFDTGVYNCVSSAVVYSIACVYFGINVEGVLTVDHAFSQVTEGDAKYDVETTTPYGFNPGEKREFTNAFGQTGYTYVPPGNYNLRQNIGLVRLISLILKNRISEAEKAGDFIAAVELSVERFALSANEVSYREMLQEFLNYASYLNTKGEYSSALEFIDEARDIYGLDNVYHETIGTLIYNAVVTYSERGSEQEALLLAAERFEKGDVTEEEMTELKHVVGDRLGFSAVQSNNDPVEATKTIDDLYSQGLLSRSRYIEYKIVLISKEAENLAANGEPYKALVLVRKSKEEFGTHRFFSDAERVYSHNTAVEIHNKTVNLLNSGNVDAALATVQKGLELLPGNSILTHDLKIIQSRRN